MDRIDKSAVTVDAAKMNWKEAVAKRTELLGTVNEFYKNIGDQDPSPDQVDYAATCNKSIEDLEAKINASGDFHAMRERHEQAYGRAGNTGAPPYGGEPGGDANTGLQAKTMGGKFAEFKDYREWVERIAGGTFGTEKFIQDSMSVGNSPPMPVPHSLLDRKALVTGAAPTSAGALVVPDLRGLIDLAWPKLALRDLITSSTTGSDTIEYPRVVSYTVNAAVVAEATATAGESGLKPESDLELKKETAVVKTIAHWIPATKRALSDAGQIRTLIDSFLLTGLDQVVEDQLLNGNGSGDQLLGLTNTPDLGEQPFIEDVLTTTRKARTRVEQIGLSIPNGYLLNPYDWEHIELTKDGMDRYYYGGPSIIATPRLWGLPVVTSIKQPKGAGYCGDFKQIIVWDREQANIRVSDGVRDFFIRNMVAILAELRLANGVLRPKAIVEMDLFAGRNS